MPVTVKSVIVEYEIPPMRAIYSEAFEDFGYNEDEVKALFAEMKPNAIVRKVTFRELETE